MKNTKSISGEDQISLLYVDDEPELLNITKFYLEETGEFRVDIMSSGEEALDTSDILSYDAIISDYHMPDMNGITFLKKVREMYGDMPFILFIGGSSEEILIEAINNGADFYLQKSGHAQFPIEELIYGIRQAVKKKRAEEALRESEEKFRSFVENANEILFSLAPDGTFTYVSPNWTELLGHDISEVIGRPSADFIHPLDLPVEREHFIRILTTGEKKTGIEYRIRHQDGTWQWHSQSISPVYDKSGRIIAVQGISHDITRRRRSEEALRESEEKFRSFVENANEILYSLTPNGIFTYISPKITELLGYEIDEIIGKPSELFIHPDDYSRNHEIHIQAIKTGKNIVGNEFRIKHKDGSWEWFTQSISPIHDADGNVIRVQGISYVITERRRSEEAIRKANRQLSLLSGITRHDILNRITVILGYLEVAETDFTDPVMAEHIRRMKWATKEIQSQIEFTRVYEQLGSHEPKWIQIDNVMPRSSIPVSITMTTDLEGIYIFADPMLFKVFFNLQDNSVRHGKQVTEIHVSASRSDKNLIIVWEDDGVGIAPEEKEKIFERGYGKNTGLGMFLVREILSLTDITIHETGEPGKGTRFEILVPKGAFKIEKKRE